MKLAVATIVGFFTELEKLGAVTDDQARRSLDRLDSLERSKPTAGQVGRYGALGAGAGALTKAVGHSIEHGHLPTSRAALGGAAAGAIGMGAMPLVRSALDRRAEYGTLKKYMQQPEKTAAEEEEQNRNPNLTRYQNLKKSLKGSGLYLSSMAGAMGLGALFDHRARQAGMPVDAALGERVRAQAHVPIVEPPSGLSSAYFSPGRTIVPGLGGPDAPHVALHPIMKAPAVLAHELGHADIHNNRVGRAVQNQITAGLGGLSGAAGSLGGFATGALSDNPTVHRLGVLAPLIMEAPTLGYEGAASVNALRRLSRAGANRKQLLSAVGTLAPAWGTYASRAGLGVGNAYINQGAGGALRGQIKRLAKEKKTAGTTFAVETPLVGDKQYKTELHKGQYAKAIAPLKDT